MNDILEPNKKDVEVNGNKGKYISKWPMIVFFFIVGLVLAGLVIGGVHRIRQKAEVKKNDKRTTKKIGTSKLLQDYLDKQPKGYINSKSKMRFTTDVLEKKGPINGKRSGTKREKTLEEKAYESYIMVRIDAYQKAVKAGTNVPIKKTSLSVGKSYRGVDNKYKFDGRKDYSDRLEALKAYHNTEPDLNIQKDKLDFFNDSPDTTKYLSSTRTDVINDFEIKTGTVIPGIMISGINSDLPGNIIAQVSQDVYDTATGNHMLIPQGTRLYGTYSSKVSYGQSRALVAWNRLIFPDGSTLEIGHMPGSDQSGYAGFKDKVNHHYARIFGQLFLLSVFNAIGSIGDAFGDDTETSSSISQDGYEIIELFEDVVVGFDEDGKPIVQRITRQEVVPVSSQSSNSETSQSPARIFSGEFRDSLAMQTAQIGTELTRKNLKIQPTISIRPGYKFNIMVNKDMLFKEPYEPLR